MILFLFVFFLLKKFSLAQDFQANCINIKATHHPVYNIGEFYKEEEKALGTKKLNFKKFADLNTFKFTIGAIFKPEKLPDIAIRGVIFEIPSMVEIFIKRTSAGTENYGIGIGKISGISSITNERLLELQIVDPETSKYREVVLLITIESSQEETKISLTAGVEVLGEFTLKTATLISNGNHGTLQTGLENVLLFSKDCNKPGECIDVIPAKGEVGVVHGYSISFGFVDGEETTIPGGISSNGVLKGVVYWEDYYLHFLEHLGWNFTC